MAFIKVSVNTRKLENDRYNHPYIYGATKGL